MAKTRNEHSLEEAKASITEIVSAMSESELEKFLTVLEKWWNFNRGKREHARKDLSVYALFMVGNYFFRDYITNISAGGLFLETKTPATVDEKVTIAFTLSDNEDPIEVEGKIVRVKPNGFGVKFDEPLAIEKEINIETNNRKKNSIEEVHFRTSEIIFRMLEKEMRKPLTGLEKWQQSMLVDKREHSRKHTSIYAFFKTNGLSFKDFIKNLSAGGLFIETGIPIKVAGKIVRIDSKGIGVKFDQPQSDI
jgi:Tfp pilus assembly protein PilZ